MRRKKRLKIVVTDKWQPDEFLRNSRASFTEAKRRVGEDSRSRLSWLLEFVYLTPEKMTELTSDEREQLRFDLAYFAASPTPWKAPSSEEIAALAAELKSGMEQLIRTTRWMIKLPNSVEVQRTIAPRPPRWPEGRIIWDGFESIFTSSDFRTSFLLRATDAIEAEATRINVCTHCGRMFARNRRARYCSLRCSQKERDTRFRNSLTADERSTRRHRYYKRRVERVRGRAVASKVRRRALGKEGSRRSAS